jgi:7-keto-8-aminopelargonate synthetase-like enzyme
VLKEHAVSVLRTYGVGPCGPPGFYGTLDVHMTTEANISAHLGLPACIVYAQAFSTISSVIPAFSKRGDIIVADESVNYAIRKGLQISRSTVFWYRHNDMAHLEEVLKKVVKDQARKPLTRRFIVSEGLFENVGDISDLPSLVCPFSERCIRLSLTLASCLDRIKAPLQIPPYPRRILVLRCSRRYRSWPFRTQQLLNQRH